MKFFSRIAATVLVLSVIAGCAGPSPPPVMESYDQASKAVFSSDADERMEAIEYLGASGNVAAVPLLISCLADEDKWIRLEATLALRNFQTPLAIESLRRLLQDTDGDVRFSAASALFELGDYSGEKALIEGLGSPKTDFRFQALMFLGKMKSGKAVPRISEILLGDPQPRTRSTAAYILGLFGVESAIEPLLKAMNDPDLYVRKDAWEALKAITAQDFPFHCEEDEDIRKIERETWVRWWEEEKEKGKIEVEPGE